MKAFIEITGVIGEQTTLASVISQVKKVQNVSELEVRINSVGGLVTEGFLIYDYLKNLQLNITTIADSFCASIATVIFMAGNKRVIKPNTEFMIHAPHVQPEESLNAGQLQMYADEMLKCEKQLIDFYENNTNLTKDELKPLLQNDTYLTSEQARNFGFSNSDEIPQLKAVAMYNINLDNNQKMNVEDKNWLDKQFSKIENLFKIKAKALLLQDSNGVEINFTELETGATPQVGDVATIDGQPAEGTYVMPQLEDASVVFVSGAVTEIIPYVEEEDELAKAKQRVAELEAQIETSKKDALEKENQLLNAQADFLNFKKEFSSKFKLEFEKEKKQEEKETSTFVKALENLKNSKKLK